MRKTNVALALLTAAALASCGGGDCDTPVTPPPPHATFSAQVTFGDGLNDVGSYAVGAVLGMGGGKFTINGDNTASNPALTGKNWTELTAAQFGLAAPCAAQTGLDGDPAQGFSVPVANHTGCFGYAQGGARVTDPIGLFNAATGSPLGALTVPVATQVANHLAAVGGKFAGDEIVFVNGGASDLRILLNEVKAGAAAAADEAGKTVFDTAFPNILANLLAQGASNPGAAEEAILAAVQPELANPAHTLDSIVAVEVASAAAQPGNAAVASLAVYGPLVDQAQTDAQALADINASKASAHYIAEHGAQAIAAITATANDLGYLIKNEILGKGASRVVVSNLPDPASTPGGRAEQQNVQDLATAMADAFNAALKACVDPFDSVLLIDLEALYRDEVANPGSFGLTDATTAACGPNALGGLSLLCNASNTLAGVDVSHFMFADRVHPTPFQGTLIAHHVLERMTAKGWF
jgi:phospholipase/lecithinase/hemolysin